MVDAADALLAVCREGASGGTQYTVEYAWQKNRELVVIDPDPLERRLLPPRLTAFYERRTKCRRIHEGALFDWR